MSRDDFSMKLERAFVELVRKKADAGGYKKGEFAAKVWSDDTPKSAGRRWSVMRNTAKNTGRPQGVLLSDASRMAEALGENLGYLLVVAEAKVREEDGVA